MNYSGSPLGTDSETTLMFTAMDDIVNVAERYGVTVGRDKLLRKRLIINRRAFINQEFVIKDGTMNTSPLSAIEKVPTQYLLNYLSQFENSKYHIGELLRSRQETIIYKVDELFRLYYS